MEPAIYALIAAGIFAAGFAFLYALLLAVRNYIHGVERMANQKDKTQGNGREIVTRS